MTLMTLYQKNEIKFSIFQSVILALLLTSINSLNYNW